MHNDKKKMFLSVIRLLAMSYLKPMKVNVTSVLIIFCHFCTDHICIRTLYPCFLGTTALDCMWVNNKTF